MPRTRTIAELRAELAASEKQLAKLQAQREKLAKQTDRLDRDIAILSGGGRRARGRAATKARGPRRRKMPRNVKPLIEYVKEGLAKVGAGMRVKDITSAVQTAGYRTFSKDFYGQVAVAVQDKAFRKLGRGVYTLRTRAKSAKRAVKAAAEAGE